MDWIIEKFSEAVSIWVSGGLTMVAIAIISLVMFSLGIFVFLRLGGKGFSKVSEKTWRCWIDHPNERKGPVGDILNFVTGGTSIKDTTTLFEELRAGEIAPFEKDLRVMKICVSVAPLLGLLGTVAGMLATFAALASGSGGDKTMGEVAKGISEALVTTVTGLVIALPGLFAHYLLARKLERYKAFLAHLEAVCTQKVYRKLHNERRRAAAAVLQPDDANYQETAKQPVYV